MNKTNKAPKRIHCTFDHAEIDPEPAHIAIYANADQYNIRMILWPAQVEALKAVLEQIQSGTPASQPLSVVWEKVHTDSE